MCVNCLIDLILDRMLLLLGVLFDVDGDQEDTHILCIGADKTSHKMALISRLIPQTHAHTLPLLIYEGRSVHILVSRHGNGQEGYSRGGALFQSI